MNAATCRSRSCRYARLVHTIDLVPTATSASAMADLLLCQQELAVLHLPYCDNLSNGQAARLLAACSALRFLSLGGARHLRSLAVLAGLPRLESVRVEGALRLNGAGALGLLGVARLREAWLELCPQVGQEAAERLLGRRPALERLELRRCGCADVSLGGAGSGGEEGRLTGTAAV
jgi:hypothetical protein